MAKSPRVRKCPQVASFSGIGLVVLGLYVLFMCWESHRRSTVTLDMASHSPYQPSAEERQLSNIVCKSLSVASSGKDQGDSVSFSVNGEALDGPPSARGINVVTIDPSKQALIAKKNYDVVSHADTANKQLASDLEQLAPGLVVAIGVKDTGLENLDTSALLALRGLGSSIKQGHFREGYALIGIKGGRALAEGQGSSAHASGILPCNGNLPSSRQSSFRGPLTERLQKPRVDPSMGEASWKEQVIETKPRKETIEGSPETTYRCVGGDQDRSCLFKNLYYHNGRFAMFVLKEPTSSIEVFRADKYEGTWKPDIETFSSVSSIQKHLDSKTILEERGLSVQFNPLFHHNIGHALFDGLYPAFVATVKLEVQDRPWRPVTAVDPGCFAEPSNGGELRPGELIEAYLPHPRYGKTLRAVHARVVSAPDGPSKEADCDWRENLDHSGLDLGSQPVDSGNQRAACIKICALSFGCKAAVLFADICYLKGAGNPVQKPDRWLCTIKGDGPKANVVVKAEPPFDGDIKDVTIPDAWITGRVRPRCMSEDIYEMFGGVGEHRRLFEMERDSRAFPDLLLRFEEVVIGVGGAGNMVADRSGAIGGSLAPMNAMSQFRDRMLRSYGLPVSRGVVPVSPDRDLNVIIISNKRFIGEERDALNGIVDRLNHKGGVHAEFIDWGRIGSGAGKFKEHLKRTQEADIYVSCIGTALQYVPFMKDGKVYIATGSVWRRSGQYFPTFMEQQLAGGGTPYLRTLYADPGGVLRAKLPHPDLGEDGFFSGVNGTLVQELMDQAEVLARKGFEIPIAPDDNLSVEARLLVELCRRDDAACKTMTANRNGAVHDCALLLWNEAVVYEVGPWRKGAQCGSAHHTLLRQLRREYGLTGYGAPET